MTSYNRTAIEAAQQPLTKLLKESLKMVQHKIEVSNKEEGKAVEKAMSNPVTRAIVVVEGVLAELDEAQQKRVLSFVMESINGSNDNQPG